MTKLPQRKSPRLPDYDYSQSGGYFITICTHEKQPTIGAIIANYKASVTRVARREHDATSTIWQSRYHDHIIRNLPDLNRIREYVQYNPARWQTDTFYESM